MADPMTWTEARLQAFCDDAEPETNALEFKDARALSKDDQHRWEIGKDVSAFANAGGGILIYGIGEKSGKADKITPIIDPKYTVEWLDQMIRSQIQPKVAGVKITPVTVPGGLAYVVEIPQATTLAPHMSLHHHSYYTRTNARSEAMDDFQIRDVMRRATTPALRIEGQVYGPRQMGKVMFGDLRLELTNSSATPALYSTVKVGIEAHAVGDVVQSSEWLGDSEGFPELGSMPPMQYYRMNLAVPLAQPIYKEASLRLPPFHMKFPEGMAAIRILTKVTTPGFSDTRLGFVAYQPSYGICRFDWDEVIG